jgi:hypothetical protein
VEDGGYDTSGSSVEDGTDRHSAKLGYLAILALLALLFLPSPPSLLLLVAIAAFRFRSIDEHLLLALVVESNAFII